VVMMLTIEKRRSWRKDPNEVCAKPHRGEGIGGGDGGEGGSCGGRFEKEVVVKEEEMMTVDFRGDEKEEMVVVMIGLRKEKRQVKVVMVVEFMRRSKMRRSW